MHVGPSEPYRDIISNLVLFHVFNTGFVMHQNVHDRLLFWHPDINRALCRTLQCIYRCWFVSDASVAPTQQQDTYTVVMVFNFGFSMWACVQVKAWRAAEFEPASADAQVTRRTCYGTPDSARILRICVHICVGASICLGSVCVCVWYVMCACVYVWYELWFCVFMCMCWCMRAV